jgi:hypothetical protein
MLQWLYVYVVRVYSKCFICFKRMLQVFYLDVAYFPMAMLQSMFQIFDLFQTYVAIVSSEYYKSRSGCRVIERGRES